MHPVPTAEQRKKVKSKKGQRKVLKRMKFEKENEAEDKAFDVFWRMTNLSYVAPVWDVWQR